MKKNLEDKIMDRVYSVETKRTGLSLILKFIGFIFVGGTVLLFIQIIDEYLAQGDIINTLRTISEDREVFVSHIGEVVHVIFDEVPSPLTLFVIIGSIICIFIVLTIILNFEKIRNRIRAIVLHWRR